MSSWVLLALFNVAVLAVLAAITVVYVWGLAVPSEVPRADRPLFRIARSACRRDFTLGAWGDYPPGLHRYDAHLYMACYVIMRDVYLPDGAALSRGDREIVATAVSVANRCHFCIHNHARLVYASDAEVASTS